MAIDFLGASGQLQQDLETLLAISREFGLDTHLLDEVLQRLREHRFAVAVVGEFKTGKSTFINALLGEDLVPTDVLATTATLNRIRYGLDAKVEIHKRDGSVQEIPPAELKNYVTKQDAAEPLLESIEEVVVFDNSPYLMNGVDLIDTPGLNDEDSMTSVTLGVLPKIDAAILVVSALSPLSQYTRDFLERHLLTADLGRVLFVVNRIGQVGSDADADRVIGHVQKTIQERITGRARSEYGENDPRFAAFLSKLGRVKVHGMDSALALRARMTGDADLAEKSRFPRFDAALRHFLNEDRGALVLQTPVNRVLASLREIELAVAARASGVQMEFSAFVKKCESDCEAVSQLRERKREEMAAIEAKAEEACAAALPKLAGAHVRIAEKMREKVMALDLNADEVIADRDAVGQKVLAAGMDAWKDAMHAELEAASLEVNEQLRQAAERVHAFSSELEAKLNAVSLAPGAAQDPSITAWLLDAGGVLAFGGTYAGYKKAGLKGAITGAITGHGASLVTAGFLSMLGAPLLPVAAGVLLTHWLVGAKATEMIFPQEEVARLKESVVAKVEERFPAAEFEGQLREVLTQYTNEAFKNLRLILQREARSVLDNTQKTLDQLRDERTRKEVETSHAQGRHAEIGERIRAMRTRAAAWNGTLQQRMQDEQ